MRPLSASIAKTTFGHGVVFLFAEGILDLGVARGEISAGMDAKLGTDRHGAPILHRCLTGRTELKPDMAGALVDRTFRGIAPQKD